MCAPPKAGLIVKLSNCRIMHGVHVSIPDAAHTHAARTGVAAHGGKATAEEQVAGIGATNRGTPHVAHNVHTAERAIAVAAAANGPLQC